MKNSYNKAYKKYQGSKGLYYLVDPESLKLRKKVIDQWSKFLTTDSYEIISSTLIPLEVLKNSGHLKHQNQLFKVGEDLCLRPETAQSIFANLREIRRELKGFPLRLHQIGKAYRKEKSTRGGIFRRNEFEQLELEILCDEDHCFFQEYLSRLNSFFKNLGLKTTFIEVSKEERPHYSNKTIDIYDQNQEIELGCLNDRGKNDLYDFSQKEKENLKIFEVSLGLDRIVELINKNLKS